MSIHHTHTIELHPHLGLMFALAIVLAGVALVVWSKKG